MKGLTGFLSLFISITFFCSCSQGWEGPAEISQNYELKIVDSVQVDLLAGYLSIVDVQEKTGQLLAIQGIESKAHVISPEGQILTTMDRPKDDPEGVGRLVSGEFYEDGIALMGVYLLKTYDMEFKLRKALRPQYPPTQMIYIGSNHLFEIPTDESNLLLSYTGAPQTEYQVIQKDYYENYNIFDLVAPGLVDSTSAVFSKKESQELFKPLGGFAPDSRYLKGRAYYLMRAIFDVKEKSAFYAFSTDTTLYEMSLPEGTIINSYTIPFDDFILFSGYTMGPEGIAEQYKRKPEGLSGRIDHVFRVDDLDIIIYTSGLNHKKLAELDPSSSDYQQRLKKANKRKLLIVKDGKRVNLDMSLPESVGVFQLADHRGFIWAGQNINALEEEPELITFYKLKVVPVQ